MARQNSSAVNDEVPQSLSDFHREFLERYMEVELLRQQVSSDRFLKERAAAKVTDGAEA